VSSGRRTLLLLLNQRQISRHGIGGDGAAGRQVMDGVCRQVPGAVAMMRDEREMI